MPQRSTPFQAIVHLVRQHFVQPGVTITESKFLRDSVLGVEREVDVVIEGNLDGEPMVVSLEVIEHTRDRADLPWVEQMIQKHQNLPTNRLLLVSKSGFSKNALAKVASQAGRVQALQPEIIERDGQPVIRRLFADAIKVTPTGCTLVVNLGGDEHATVAGEPLTDVCDGAGALLGPLGALVHETITSEAVWKRLAAEAHFHPEKEQVKGFTFGLALPQLGYHLRQMETGELHLIEGLEVRGDFAIQQTEIPLTLADLGGRIYGAAEAEIAGHPTVWVGTTDVQAQTTTLSYRAMDGAVLVKPPPPPPAAAAGALRFPGLLTLSLPDMPTDALPQEEPTT